MTFLIAPTSPLFRYTRLAHLDEKKRRASGLPPTQRPRRPTEVGRGAAGERLSAVPEAGPHEFAEDVFLQPEYGPSRLLCVVPACEGDRLTWRARAGADLGGFEHFHFDEVRSRSLQTRLGSLHEHLRVY